MEQLPSWIPEPEWAGNAVIDVEAWNPIWRLNAEQNGGKHNRYQLYSIALVGAAHPEWSAEQKEAVARAAGATHLGFTEPHQVPLDAKSITCSPPEEIAKRHGRYKMVNTEGR